jgi:hypothetical protein
MDKSQVFFFYFSNSVFELWRPPVTFETPKSVLFHKSHKISERWICHTIFLFFKFRFWAPEATTVFPRLLRVLGPKNFGNIKICKKKQPDRNTFLSKKIIIQKFI